MKNFRNRIWIGFVFAVLLLVALGALNVQKCGSTPDPKKEIPVVSPAEVADKIIEKEKKQAEAKSASSGQSSTQTPTKPPTLSDKVFYLEKDIDLMRANFLKEVKVFGIYGGEWSLWAQSAISFRKDAYKGQEVSQTVHLEVFLKPTSDRDDKNYVEFNFVLHPPGVSEERWSATLEFFTARTQGSARFPFAHDIFVERWQKEEITHLGRQILDIVFPR